MLSDTPVCWGSSLTFSSLKVDVQCRALFFQNRIGIYFYCGLVELGAKPQVQVLQKQEMQK